MEPNQMLKTTLRILGAAALAVSLGFAAGADGKKSKPVKKTATKKAATKKTAKAGGDAAKGEDIYKSNCAVCHYADKTDKRIGPGLLGYFKKEKMENGKPVNEASTRELILEGEGKMIPFKEKLDEKQVDDVLAYLKTL